MKIGKLDVTRWEYNGRNLKNPARIIASIVAFPVYLVGKSLIVIAITISDLSVSAGLDSWRDI